MNWRLIINRISAALFIEAGCMTPALAISLIYGDGDTLPFILSIAIVLALALIARMIKPREQTMYSKDGFALGGFGWLAITALGALPYLLSPEIHSYADAFFETAAGFSTTGATVFPGLVGLSHALLFWRSITHWMGGLGFLMLIIALLPSMKANALHMLRVESTGPSLEKFVPNIQRQTRILYLIYTLMTAALAAFLIAEGMPLFDSVCYALSTISTGGFDTNPLGLAAYNNPHIEIVAAAFMLLAGGNLTLYYLLFRGRWKELLRDEELRFFYIVSLSSMAMITINIYQTVYPALGESIRRAFFQVSSIITTTGFTTADYTKWPAFSQAVLLLLMLIGGCAGSTAGGIKAIRWLLLFKIARREIYRILHPRARRSITLNGRAVEDDAISGTTIFISLYMVSIVILTLIVSLDGRDMLTNITAAIACVANIGPGLAAVGPAGSFADFSSRSKVFLSIGMIVGRLEIYPLLILCSPAFWKRVNI